MTSSKTELMTHVVPKILTIQSSIVPPISSRNDRSAEPGRRNRHRRTEHDERVQADTANGRSPGAVPGHHAKLYQGATGRIDQLRRVRVLEPRPRSEHDVICYCCHRKRQQQQRPDETHFPECHHRRRRCTCSRSSSRTPTTATITTTAIVTITTASTVATTAESANVANIS